MIRLTDSVILAYTKLRTHKVRTGLTVGIAGILFGLILGVIFVAQGVFDSIGRFSEEGLANRAIVAITKSNLNYYNPYDHNEDADFIAEVKEAHEIYVDKKTTISKKYSIPYNARTEDPLPIKVDKDSRLEYVDDDNHFQTPFIQEIITKRTQKMSAPLDIEQYLAQYDTATVLRGNILVANIGDNAPLVFMQDGREEAMRTEAERQKKDGNTHQEVAVQVLHSSLTEPFITQKEFDYTKGEIPGVVSFAHAERLLGLKQLPRTSTNEEKLQRITDVRNRIGEVTASFCYRNPASQQLLSMAISQRDEIEENKTNTSYVKPSIIYQLPADDSCGAVTIASDTRTVAEKQRAESYENYQKEMGEYIGDPWQHKITMRAIGLTGDAQSSVMTGTAGDIVMSLLGSWLTAYGDSWSIPVDMLGKLPEGARPMQIFPDLDAEGTTGMMGTFMDYESYMVEFDDAEEARDLLRRGGAFTGQAEEESVYATPFGSGTLTVDELKRWFGIGLWWTLAVVGGVAFIILAGLIGRMVSDGRRESAVFRAIGARRTDIGRIYGAYTVLLSLRVVVFAVVLGLILAIVADLWLTTDATTAARLAYAAVDTTKEFHFISIWTWYVPVILGAIVAVSLLASIIPILLGARRNPITDMRNDT